MTPFKMIIADISHSWWRHPTDSTERSQDQLDFLLVFAGLFSVINGSFLTLTLPRLSPDPAEDTNALLSTLAMQNNMKENGIYDLPSTSFSPPRDIVVINVCFSLSLMFSILASALVVLAQQGIAGYHDNRDGKVSNKPSPTVGTGRWALQFTVVDGVLSLLLASLLTFCISLVLYLHHLKPVIGIIVGIPVHFAFLACVAMYTLDALRNSSSHSGHRSRVAVVPVHAHNHCAVICVPPRNTRIEFCIRLGDNETRVAGEGPLKGNCKVHISVLSQSEGLEAWSEPSERQQKEIVNLHCTCPT